MKKLSDLRASDQNIFACGILIDQQRTFDTVNHNIPLQNLDHYEITAWLLLFIFYT